MLERTLNARLPPRSTVFLSLPPHPHRRFINYSSPPRTRCHIPLRHVAPLVYRSSNFDNSPPTCLARTNILRRKLDKFSPTTLVTQHFVIQNSLSLSVRANSSKLGRVWRPRASLYLDVSQYRYPELEYGEKRGTERSGLSSSGYLARGECGVPRRSSRKGVIRNGIIDREADLSIMRHRLSNQSRRRLPVLEARGISRSPSRGEGRGGWTTTIGISDSWPMGRVFIWIAISPSSALLSLYDRFIDRSLRIEASCLDRNNKWKLLSSNN